MPADYYTTTWDNSFQRWELRKARKAYRCDAGCGESINAGEQYWYGAYCDYAWSTLRLHQGCHDEGLEQAREWGEVEYESIAVGAIDAGKVFIEHEWRSR